LVSIRQLGVKIRKVPAHVPTARTAMPNGRSPR
jgi:hypothetical protein